LRRGARALVYLGTAAAVLGLGKLHAAYIGNYDYTGSSRFAWSIAYIGVLCVSAYGAGLPDVVRQRSAIVASLGATAAAALGVSFLQILTGSAQLPRYVVLGAAALLVPWYSLCALLAAGGRARQEGRDRVVAVVGAEEAEALSHDLSRSPERPAFLAWTLVPAEATASGERQPLVDAVESARASVVVLDRAAQSDETVVAQAARLHERGVRVRTLSLFYEEWLGKLPHAELERVSLMFDIGELHRARYGRLKRLVDVIVATTAVVPLVVALPFVALGNVIANRGPLFYRQERVGKNGQRFRIVKFRTMRPGQATSSWTTVGDPRVTPFGRWMRGTHLDELPQAVNILRGDLAIVGPRPEQPRYVEELAEKIPFYDLRHLVRPGLTGWAQVKYPYGADEMDALEKLQYEFYYLRHQSLTLDARIIGRTIRHVAGRGGR
jgi:lipopolysaccharide/colanic/teichoic acid biosynthesis glycosyltransferase